MKVITVRKRRGRIRHGVTETMDSATAALCSVECNPSVIDDRGVNCRKCLAEIDRLGWTVSR